MATETGNGTTRVTTYTYGNGLLSQSSISGSLTFHYNNIGSTILLTNEQGEKEETYSSGPYGELLSGDRTKTPYLYNGMYGVATDANGLYYMRARYYNVAIKRFINQDVVDGSITNSQSLNKFSYVQGNPIRLTDPFGLCPDISLTRIGHAALDLLGIIPGLDGCDGINAVWYLIEGDYANAATSAVAALPLLGSIIGSGIKWGAKGVANAEKIADGIKTGSRIIGNVGVLIQSGGQTLESVGNLYDSYVKNGEIISWKNATDLITLGLSVAGMGMAGKSLAKDGKALKAVSQGNVNVKPAAVSNSTASSGRFKMDLQMFASSNGSQNKKVLGGKFKDVDAARGVDEVGHHMPQNKFNEKELGLARNDGPTLLMTKVDHALTRTYRGRGKKTMVIDAGLTARQRMVLDIINIRENFGTKYNKGMLEAIKYAKTLPDYQKR